MVMAEVFDGETGTERGDARPVHACSPSGMAQPRITSSICLASTARNASEDFFYGKGRKIVGRVARSEPL